MSSEYHSALTPGLSGYVSQEDLDRNSQIMCSEVAALYPEPDESLLERVRQHLLRLPLIYTTTSDKVAQIRMDGIAASDAALPLKRNLGLDAYVRMGWGERALGAEGRYYQEVDASLLLHPTTIVTRGDIVRVPGVDLVEPFNEQRRDVQHAIQEQYLKSVVTGRDWLDIAARNVLGHMTANGGDPVPLRDLGLGEIKHHGLVSLTMLGMLYSDAHGADGLSQIGPPESWPLEAPSPIELDHKLIRLGFVTKGYEAEMVADRGMDMHPEMPAVSTVLTQQARRLWASILEIK